MNSSLVYKIRSNKPETFNLALCNLQALKGNTKAKVITYLRNSDDEYADYYYRPKDMEDGTLVFESRFECGNLAMASKIAKNEYNLILQNDVNTHGYGQWFFFEVKNAKPKQKVKFNIINYRKDDSLHNHGMKILVFSTKKAEQEKVGWSRDGFNLNYSCNTILRQNIPNRFYRTLSWEYEFKYSNDKVFFAYTHPYTYTDLVEYLDGLEDDEIKSKYFTRSTLCRTVAGNKCEVLTIAYHKNPEDALKKQCIVLTARVHPGETCSSFVIQGVIDFLLSEAKEAQLLRENFIFKIIPMLNPDGVIHGNSRCSLEGCDLNRKWKAPSQTLHPTIYYTKKLIKRVKQKYGVAFYCDFHGHSKKKDMFMYGCQDVSRSAEARVFPWMLSQISSLFNYYKCTFHVHPSKAGTSRVVLFKQYKIFNACTIETSFFGSEKTNSHYTANDLINFGAQFCKTLRLFFYKETLNVEQKESEEFRSILEQREQMIKNLYASKSNLLVGLEDDSGSDSQGSEDDLSITDLQKVLPGVKPPQGGESPRRVSPTKDTQRISRSLLDKKSPERSPPLMKSPEGQKIEKKQIYDSRIFNRHLKSSSLTASKIDSNLLLPVVNKVYKLGSVRDLSLSSSPNYSKILLGNDFPDKEIREVKIFQPVNFPSRGAQNYRKKGDLKSLDLVPNLKSKTYAQTKAPTPVETSIKIRTQEQSSPTTFQSVPRKAVMIENSDKYYSNQKTPLKTRTGIFHVGFKKPKSNTQNERSQSSLKSMKTLDHTSRNVDFSLLFNKDKFDLNQSYGSPLARSGGCSTDRDRKFEFDEIEPGQLGIVQEASKERLEDTQESLELIGSFNDIKINTGPKHNTMREKIKEQININLPFQLTDIQKFSKPITPLPTLQSLLMSMGSKDKADKRKSVNTVLFQSGSPMDETYPKTLFMKTRLRSKTNLRSRPQNLPKLSLASYQE